MRTTKAALIFKVGAVSFFNVIDFYDLFITCDNNDYNILFISNDHWLSH